jgi:hypothetical protein
MNPKYPVYVISKGRADSRQTVKALDKIKVPYNVVIEPQEFKQYAAVIDERKLLVLPHEHFGGGCSIPARNWVWEHSICNNHEKHWILDDNIQRFWRSNRNLRIEVDDGTIFRCCEDFTERYDNVAISGMNYYMFAPDRAKFPPFYLNTRIYSCILLNNSLYMTNMKDGEPFRWRGRYNEDTDLSIRALKSNWCTILFNAFLAQKLTTGTVKGGNMTEIYGGDHLAGNNKADAFREKRMLMAQSLRDQHPDIVVVTEKWGRPQHNVNYDGFTQKLHRKDGWNYEGVDNYGMTLKRIAEDKKPKAKQESRANAEAELELNTADIAAEAKGEEYWKEYWASKKFEGQVRLE